MLDQVQALLPALAFLLAAVPLAELLERLGFFDAVAALLRRRSGPTLHLGWLWALAGVTTVVLNLDTTIILLTPLCLRLARRAGAEPVRVAAIPLVLASLASSVLVVSNLTNLIVAERFGTTSVQVAAHLGLPTVVAVAVGWLAFRRGGSTLVLPAGDGAVDHRALRLGGLVVAGLLPAFVVGPSIGVDPWVSALVADLVLVGLVRAVPWRSLPIGTAVGVAVVGASVAVAVPEGAVAGLTASDGVVATAGSTLVGGLGANLVNNLPALFVGANSTTRMAWGMWGWLWGVNAAAALLPVGALANVLWRRILRDDGEPVGVAHYLSLVVPIVLPAFVAGGLVLVAQAAATV